MALNSISNRLTPSVPIEITFGAQPVATGTKVTTLFGHRAASGGTGLDYAAITVVNVGDPDAAKLEVEGYAGAGSQIAKMAYAFVQASVAAGRSNFPAFRVVLIPSAQTGFGPADEALTAVKFLRSDMFVSCYPASSATLRTKLINLCLLISGIDRDLAGQFGSFATFGSVDALSTAVAYNINSRSAIVAYLQDTNTALITQAAALTLDSPYLTGLSSTAGINLGAVITGTGVPAGAVVGAVEPTRLLMVDSAGNPLPAAATVASASMTYQNVISQPEEIIASAHAASMMWTALPYRPLQGVTVGGLVPPQKRSDWIQIDPNGASEQALAAGLSPMYVQPGNQVGLIRTRTTATLRPDGVTPLTAYFDWQELVVLNDFREDCYLISQNPPFNNNPGGAKASARIAGLFKDEVLRQAFAYQDAEAFQFVKELAPQFIVQPSTTSRGRFDFKIPTNVVPGLMVIAGNIEASTESFAFTI